MKISNILLVLFGVYLFTACNKAPEQGPSKQIVKPQFVVNGGFNWIFNGNDCNTAGSTCMDPVIITAPAVAGYAAFQTAVASGPSAIGTYFTSGSWSTVFPDLADGADATKLTELQSGNYSITAYTNGTTKYYSCGQTGFSTPEFILQATQ